MIIRAVVTQTVNEKRRRAINATAYSTHEILADSTQINMLGQSALDLRRRNAYQRHVFGEMLIVEQVLVRIKHVVHLPELIVRARRLRNLGSVLGMGMYLAQRKVAKNESESIAQLSLNFVNNRAGQAAVGALIVAILDQRHWCVCWPSDVIAFAHG